MSEFRIAVTPYVVDRAIASMKPGEQVAIRHPGGQTVCTVTEFPIVPPRYA